MDNDNTQIPRGRRGDETPRDGRIRLRNALNIIFMVGAVAGVAVYTLSDRDTGVVIVLAAMVFKIAEAALRLLR